MILIYSGAQNNESSSKKSLAYLSIFYLKNLNNLDINNRKFLWFSDANQPTASS